MGISGWEALGYVFQGASEASDEIRKEDVALAMENFKHDKEVIGEMFTDKLIFFDRVGDYSTSQILHTYNKEIDWTLQTR